MDVVEDVLDGMERYIRHKVMGDPVTLGDVMADLPDVDDDRTVDLVLDACLQSYPPSCASLAAVRYNRVEMLLRSAPTFVPELQESFWREAVQYLVDTDCWQGIQALLAHGKGKVCWSLLGSEAAESFQDHPAAVDVFDLLAARCLETECACIGQMVSCMMWRGLVDWFGALVYSDRATVRQYVLDNMHKLISHSIAYRQAPDRHPGHGLNGCLAVACEAGLFTTGAVGQDSEYHTAMGLAVFANQPDLVRFLYHAGATDNHNRELLQLSRSPDLVAKTRAPAAKVRQLPKDGDYPASNDANAARNIQDFLARMASTPRSLQTQCLLQVSRALGWGHGRESRIEQLDVPPAFKRALKFQDLKDFLKYPSLK